MSEARCIPCKLPSSDVADLDVTLACHDLYERTPLVSPSRPCLVWPGKAP